MLIKKRNSIWFLSLVYLVALVVGVFVYRLSRAALGSFWPMLLADIAATLVVWAFGLVVKNASVYDPYWSVAPAVMAVGWMVTFGAFGAAQLFLFAALVIWGVRLTANFITGWPGLKHQDWRYGMLKDKNPKIWWVTNLFGINLFPTWIVFACMIPAYIAVSHKAGISLLSVAGLMMSLGAVYLQIAADGQMRAFRQTKKPGEHIETGLWRLSRHPNYFGEVLFWWGIWTMQMGTVPEVWITVLAPTAMTAMFLFVSIPMMETHMLEKCPGYSAYQKRVSVLIPLTKERPWQTE